MLRQDEIIRWIERYAGLIAANRDYLTQLDSDIGDADHGINMQRGFNSVLQKLPGVANQDIGAILKAVGMTLVSTVGGASGPLYGTFFLQMGMATVGKAEISPEEWIAALEAGVNGVVMRGKANLGDKTMLDALAPALSALKSAVTAEASFPEALRWAEQAGEKGMTDTIPLVARKGRASYLGERSAGHQDPGATSSYLLLKAAAETWAGNAKA